MDNRPEASTKQISAIKKNSHWSLTKSLFWANFIASAISLIFIYMIMSVFSKTTALIIQTGIGGLILLAIAYSAAWHSGTKDYNLVKFGHVKYQPFKGLQCGLMSQIPAAILAILCIIRAATDSLSQWVEIAYRLLFACVIGAFELTEISPYFYLLPLLAVPVAAAVGYALGYRQISLMENMVFKKKREDEAAKSKSAGMRG